MGFEFYSISMRNNEGFVDSLYILLKFHIYFMNQIQEINI